jgi:hypothetical protein
MLMRRPSGQLVRSAVKNTCVTTLQMMTRCWKSLRLGNSNSCFGAVHFRIVSKAGMARRFLRRIRTGSLFGSNSQKQVGSSLLMHVRPLIGSYHLMVGSCEQLIEDERGGDPFWIPRACTVGIGQAVEIVSWFIERGEPSPSLSWCFWHQLPLPDSYPKP